MIISLFLPLFQILSSRLFSQHVCIFINFFLCVFWFLLHDLTRHPQCILPLGVFVLNNMFWISNGFFDFSFISRLPSAILLSQHICCTFFIYPSYFVIFLQTYISCLFIESCPYFNLHTHTVLIAVLQRSSHFSVKIFSLDRWNVVVLRKHLQDYYITNGFRMWFSP